MGTGGSGQHHGNGHRQLGRSYTETAVTATNVATSVNYNAPSNSLGLYTILNLPLGKYSVTFRRWLPVHRPFEHHRITAQVVQLDVKLTVGAETRS